MIKLRVADTEKNAPPEIELIPETFDELYDRVAEINSAEYPRKICSYYMALNPDRFTIVLFDNNGFVMDRFYFERSSFKSCGIFKIEDKKNRKKMSIKRLYYIAKGFLEGERLG